VVHPEHIEELLARLRPHSLIETFYKFPGVVILDGNFMEEQQFRYLLENGLIRQHRKDSFGEIFRPECAA
jgi:hypothetical protein